MSKPGSSNNTLADLLNECGEFFESRGLDNCDVASPNQNLSNTQSFATTDSKLKTNQKNTNVTQSRSSLSPLISDFDRLLMPSDAQDNNRMNQTLAAAPDQTTQSSLFLDTQQNQNDLDYSLEQQCEMLTQKILGSDLPNPQLYDPNLPEQVIKQRIRCFNKLLHAHFNYTDLKQRSQQKIQRVQHDLKRLENKCEILTKDLKLSQQECQKFKLKIRETETQLMDQAKKQKHELKQQSATGGQSATQLRKEQHLRRQTEQQLEKVQEGVRGGLKTGSISVNFLNEKKYVQEAFTVLESKDFFKEMVLGGQVAVEKQVMDQADFYRGQYRALLLGVWQTVHALVLSPLHKCGKSSTLAQELISLVPSFNFDLQLIEYELPVDEKSQESEKQTCNALLNVMKCVFQEMVSVSQVISLCSTLGVTSMTDLKTKLCLQGTNPAARGRSATRAKWGGQTQQTTTVQPTGANDLD